MLKYVEEDTMVTFSEIPDEVTLCVNISNCQNNCKGCHSPYLQQNIGRELNEEAIDELIKKNEGITCFCFMGEGKDKEGLLNLAKYIRDNYRDIKIGIYSGSVEMESEYPQYFDYVKIGPYIEEYGPLNKRTTNQRMLEYNHPKEGELAPAWYMRDITYKFWERG